MKIIAVVGTGSGCGKTTVACRILKAISGLGAVKISPRAGASKVEWGPGEPGKDTDLYAASGAVKVARIIGPRDEVGTAWEMIKGQFGSCPGVVIEGMSARDFPGERFVVLVIGKTQEKDRKAQIRAVAAISDLIIEGSSHSAVDSSLSRLRAFLAGSATGDFDADKGRPDA